MSTPTYPGAPHHQRALAAALPSGDLASAQAALMNGLDLLERDLARISKGAASLTEEQRTVLRRIRERHVPLA